jgi:hypothetical protein
MTELQEARITFRQANAFLRETREGLFRRKSATMIQTLRKIRSDKGKRRALRAMARALIDEGYYSGSSAIGQIEFSLIKRLWKHYLANHGYMKWESFARRHAGASWYAGEPFPQPAGTEIQGTLNL